MKKILASISLLVLTSTLFADNLTAIAKVDNKTKIVKTLKSKLIKFSASDSKNSEGSDRYLVYRWIDKKGTILSKKKIYVDKYDKKGIYEVTLKVTDVRNLQTVSDKISIFVDMDELQVLNYQRKQHTTNATL
jgi:hypothetical protein